MFDAYNLKTIVLSHLHATRDSLFPDFIQVSRPVSIADKFRQHLLCEIWNVSVAASSSSSFWWQNIFWFFAFGWSCSFSVYVTFVECERERERKFAPRAIHRACLRSLWGDACFNVRSQHKWLTDNMSIQ